MRVPPTQNADDACFHESASGITQRDLSDPSKVWRCDGCGWLYVHIDDGFGIATPVGVEDHLRELQRWNDELLANRAAREF